MHLDEIQKRVYANKVAKNFNVSDVPFEFCLLSGEVAEAFDAWRKKKDDLGSELADVGIYLAGLCEILGFSLHDEMVKKMEINEKREYDKNKRRVKDG